MLERFAGGGEPNSLATAWDHLASGGSERRELTLSDGRWLAILSRPAVDGGRILQWREISDSKRIEASLSESGRRLEDLSGHLPVIIYQRLLTPAGGVEYPYFSGGVREIVGVEAEAIQRDPSLLEQAIHASDRDAWSSLYLGSADTLERWSGEFRIAAPDGVVRWLRGIGEPRRRGDGGILWDCILIDISEQKLVEAELRRAKELAELASRSQVDFLANISHEFRTPLNAIIGFAEVIQNETFGAVGNAQYREYVDDIHESGMHLLELVSDLLDISRLEAGRLDISEARSTSIDWSIPVSAWYETAPIFLESQLRPSCRKARRRCSPTSERSSKSS